MGARKSDAVWPFTARCQALGCLFAIMLGVLCMAMLRHWRYDGLTRPFRIHGGSMAPSLLGEHLDTICQDCGFPIQVAVDLLANPEWLTCPNCGFRKTPNTRSERQPGERVLVDRWPKQVTGIRRWEPVAFRGSPTGGPGSFQRPLTVKRVVGLPGEQVRFSSGEIYADGVLVRKSMGQFREMAVLLFDTYYRPRKTAELIDRFQPGDGHSHWQRLATGYHFDSPDRAEPTSQPLALSDLDQLVYQHWACMANQVPWKERTAVSPVEDHYVYNHGLSRGQLLHVNDLLFRCSLTIRDPGVLVLSLFSGRDVFEIWIYTNRNRYELRRNTNSIATNHFLNAMDQTPQELEFAVVDQQVIFAVNGRTWCRHSFALQDSPEPGGLSPLDSEHPAMIAVRSMEIQIHRMRLYRDIYWTGPSHSAQSWQFKRRLKGDEFFLVGDNVPVSEDSRHWGQGISRKAILGKVLRVQR